MRSERDRVALLLLFMPVLGALASLGHHGFKLNDTSAVTAELGTRFPPVQMWLCVWSLGDGV